MEDTHTVLFVVITVALTFATVGVCHAACLWLQPRCVRRQRPPEDGASGLGSILSTHQAAAGLCWSSVDQIHAGICWNLLPADLQRSVLKFAFHGRLWRMGLVCRGWHTTLLQDAPRSVHFRLVGNEIDERIAWARISICPSWGICCFNEHIRNVPLNLDAPRRAPDHAEPWHCALDSINQIRHLNVEISDAAQALSLVRRLTVPGAEIAVDSLTLRAQYAGARSRHVRGGGWQFLAPALQRCKIRSLSLPQCVLLGDNGARAIAVALNHPQCCLQSISVCFCGIHDVGAAAFAGEICREGNLLTHLNVSSNRIGPAGAVALALAVGNKHSRVVQIEIEMNRIGPAGARSFADLAINDRQDSCYSRGQDDVLNWSYRNAIGAAGMTEIDRMFRAGCCNHVTHLKLDLNYCTDGGAVTIARWLTDAQYSITNMCIGSRGNMLSVLGVQIIMLTCLHARCKMTCLCFDHYQYENDQYRIDLRRYGTGIGDGGAAVVADTIRQLHCTLTYLNISNQDIGPEGGVALAVAALHSNVKRLVLSLNPIGMVGLYAWSATVQNPRCSIEDLDLRLERINLFPFSAFHCISTAV